MSQVSSEQLQTIHLHLFSDASYAPYRFNGRRGLSGGAIFHESSLVRSLCRQQQALSLSSCEAELYALQSVSQESLSFAKLVHRVLCSIGEAAEEQEITIWIESDSRSAIDLLRSMDVPKRSRHVEIRLLWLREKLQAGKLKLQHRAGTSNCSDIFTKCLTGQLFYKHRFTLGILVPEGLLNDLREIRELFVLCRVKTAAQDLPLLRFAVRNIHSCVHVVSFLRFHTLGLLGTCS